MKRPLLLSAAFLVLTGTVLSVREGRYRELVETRTRAEAQLSVVARREARPRSQNTAPTRSSRAQDVNLQQILNLINGPFDAEAVLRNHQRTQEIAGSASFILGGATLLKRSPEELEELLGLLNTSQPHVANSYLRSSLENLLGIPKPSRKEAMEDTLSKNQGDYEAYYDFRRWAYHKPEEALAWLRSSEEKGLLVRRGTRNDPHKTLNQDYALALLGKDAEKGIEFYESMLAEHQDTELRSELFKKLSGRSDKQLAIDFFQSIDAAERPETIRNFLKANSRRKEEAEKMVELLRQEGLIDFAQ